MPPTRTTPAAITPQGVRDGDPAVLAALAERRGRAVLAFAEMICATDRVDAAAADAFARFRAIVTGPGSRLDVHPDELLLGCARRAALDLAPHGPDLGCRPALELLVARAERTITARDSAMLDRHLSACQHCTDLAARLEAADPAYREADDEPLSPAAIGPMVAALASAAPIRPPADHPSVLPSGPHGPQGQDGPGETKAASADESRPAARPEPRRERERPHETPVGTRRVTGSPTSHYEVPQPRTARDSGPDVPLGTHRPRDLVLPAALLLVAALVIMGVSGVIGDSSGTPAAGSAVQTPPEVSQATRSATAISLSDAERIPARTGGTTTP